ncbi:MAG: hypothetical protein HYZ04_00895 [Rhodospirillales bacterium]|nr:hypothetical protein [Rhodospirillales bacterium]
MDDILHPAPTDQDGQRGTVFVFLSLFVLVLAFFIVLVSISTVETTKSKAVMQSLTSTFQAMVPAGAEPSDFTAKEGEILGGSAFQEKITNLFATAFQVAKVEIVKPGRLMQIEMPAGALFADREARVRPTAHPFLDRVVAALGARPPGLRFDMELVIGAGRSPDRMLPVDQSLEMARAGAFAREMLTRGAPPANLSIGLQPGGADAVTIRFYVRPGDEGRQAQ